METAISNCFLISHRLEALLKKIHNLQKLHGITVLDVDRTETKLYKFWKIFLKICFVLTLILTACGSLETTSTNNKFQRFFSRTAFLALTSAALMELTFYLQKQKAMELLGWCHWVETHRIDLFPDRGDWFKEGREKSFKLVKFYVTLSCIHAINCATLTPIVLSIYTGERKLLFDINIRGYEESTSWLIYWIEWIILSFGILFTVQILTVSLSIFIVLSRYISDQFRLIKFCVNRIDLHTNVPKQFKEVVQLQLDALSKVKQLSNLYIWNIKIYETLFIAACITTLVGKENMSLASIMTSVFVAFNLGLYANEVEKIVDAEEGIRDAYNELDWLDATVEVKKLILQAMRKPVEIKFAALYGQDRVSLERFGSFVKDAYDIALIFVKLAKK